MRVIEYIAIRANTTFINIDGAACIFMEYIIYDDEPNKFSVWYIGLLDFILSVDNK